jgi:hypothetical protein
MSLSVVIITSNEHGNAARIGHHLARTRLADVELVGAVIDTRSAADRRRQATRLRAWYRHGGVTYATWRLWLNLAEKLRGRPRARYHRSLNDIGREFGFPVIEVPNVNSDESAIALRRLEPDVALSLGNRVISERIFTIPRQAMINLHHGKIPEYRGGPPAFWELYNGESSMGVSVHRIDARLDHGEVLAVSEVPILPGDDPRTLMERAYGIDYRLVETTLRDLARGTPHTIQVDHSKGRVNTLPTRAQVRALAKRLARPVRHDDARLGRLEEVTTSPK